MVSYPDRGPDSNHGKQRTLALDTPRPSTRLVSKCYHEESPLAYRMSYYVISRSTVKRQQD